MASRLWKWQQAIPASDLESTTRLVLHTLSTFMSVHGSGAFPSISKIAAAAGLSTKAAGLHLQKAEKAGWLIRTPRITRSNKRSYDYSAAIPASTSHEKPVNRPSAEANVIPLRRDRRSLEHRTDVPTTSVSTITSLHTNGTGEASFRALWETVPHNPRSDRSAALAIWKRMSSTERQMRLSQAARERAGFLVRNPTVEAQTRELWRAPYLAVWLKDQAGVRS